MVVLFFKPWHTACPDDAEGASGAACPMLPIEGDVMTWAFGAAVIGFIILAIGISFRSPPAAQGRGTRLPVQNNPVPMPIGDRSRVVPDRNLNSR
jgi:hypothetical protein